MTRTMRKMGEGNNTGGGWTYAIILERNKNTKAQFTPNPPPEPLRFTFAK